jgi:hypothetical protein
MSDTVQGDEALASQEGGLAVELPQGVAMATQQLITFGNPEFWPKVYEAYRPAFEAILADAELARPNK